MFLTGLQDHPDWVEEYRRLWAKKPLWYRAYSRVYWWMLGILHMQAPMLSAWMIKPRTPDDLRRELGLPPKQVET